MCSVSHTIKPGEKLCIKCGRRESLDPVWADGRRVGWRRVEDGLEGMRKARNLPDVLGGKQGKMEP
jgi:hypothetical protein